MKLFKEHIAKVAFCHLMVRYCCPLLLTSVVAPTFLSSTANTEPQSQVTAIRDARIVTVSGPTIERGTILISNGLIQSIGTDMAIPTGANVIDAKGLTAYPGLIDSLTDIGMPSPPPSASRASSGATAVARGARGPEDRPATTPWRNPIDEFTDDPRIELWRNSGFTCVVTAPQNGIFPGQGVVINLAQAQPKDLIIKDSAALLVKFERAPSLTDFPNSLMGVLGYIRQIFLDTNYYTTRASNRLNQTGPVLHGERALSTIAEALQRNTPILLPANQVVEIHRVQNLYVGLGIRNPVLYGGQGSYSVANELAKKNVSVLVSLKWPREERDPDPEFVPSMRLLRFREGAPTTPAYLHQAGVKFAFYSDGLSSPAEILSNVRESVAAGLPRDAAVRALTLSPAEIFGVSDKLGSIEPDKLANLVVTDGDLLDEGVQIRTTFVNGRAYQVPASQQAKSLAPSPNGRSQVGLRPASAEPLADSRAVFISHATILTITRGTIENGAILIRNGKIVEVGKSIKPPADALIIDATGQFVMPGIIDCHSHIGIEGTWYESGLNVSSIASIGDVLNSDDINIYRTLAGGVTTANVLYSSFNPIGGQTVVIKNRWGHPASELLFEGAPPGIKFALGENPKRGSGIAPPFGPPPRYPKTRMGVIEVMREAFVEARDYQRKWDEYDKRKNAGEKLDSPRRDLRLEPLVEVMQGKRLVHAHAYRADDILALIRVADEFGFRIATLQHAIEGYKVTKEIASHRIGASTFSDWWAYKFEAYDAIPHNAALMTARGILVSINSDTADEAHHLNQEAAKSMKWGGLSATEALKLITLNPAIQLGISNRVGSIEVGKDADLSIWNRHPLSILSVVQKVLIDGKVYFDRRQDQRRRVEVEKEKKLLHGRKSISGVSERK